MTKKYVYFFGPQGTEGDATMKNTLGGKGANLAEMAKLGLPVPAGFTISTEFCTVFFAEGRQFPQSLRDEVAAALQKTEEAMGMKFGDAENPLLLSCRSGARTSMPGMMETVLNVGLCSKTIPGLVKKSGNERFVYDAYRRLIMMYSDVVMEKAEDIEPAEGKGIRVQLEHLCMAKTEEVEESTTSDTDLTTRRSEAAVRATSRRRCWRSWAASSPTIPTSSFGAPSARCSRVGKAGGPFPTARSRAFPASGAPPATCRAWCSATWATPRPPAWPSRATRPPARTSSTASGWSMPRAKTWWPASARRTR